MTLKAIDKMTVEDYEELYDECKVRGNGEKVFIPCCDDYLPMVQKINNIIELQSVRTGNLNLLGEDYKHFVYCPWCGDKLKNELY